MRVLVLSLVMLISPLGFSQVQFNEIDMESSSVEILDNVTVRGYKMCDFWTTTQNGRGFVCNLFPRTTYMADQGTVRELLDIINDLKRRVEVLENQ